MASVLVGNCSNCDWKGHSQGESRRGSIIYCEWFEASKYIKEIENCSGWSRGARFPNETRAQYTERKKENENRQAIAERADRKALIALIISGVGVVLVLIKIIFDAVFGKP